MWWLQNIYRYRIFLHVIDLCMNSYPIERILLHCVPNFLVSSTLIPEYNVSLLKWISYLYVIDRLCGLVVRVPGYKSNGLGFDSRHYQIFWVVVGLERDPLSLLSTIEELLERKSSDSGLEIREYDRREPLCWPYNTLYPQNLTLTLSTSGCCSVGIVRPLTKTTEFVVFFFYLYVIILGCITSDMHLADNKCGGNRTEAVRLVTSGNRFVTRVTQNCTYFMPTKKKKKICCSWLF
jgi:hypothetical protein